MTLIFMERGTEPYAKISQSAASKHGFCGTETIAADNRRRVNDPDGNPPIGIILCADKTTAVAEYALEGSSNNILL